MHTMHPTLLVGPADWDPARLPREEFEQRQLRLWADHPEAGGALIYGDPRDHAALSYLTHFTPKLEAALALIPRHGTARLLVGGGANMVPAARPLTFIEDLRPLRGAEAAAEWARALPDTAQLLLIGGESMPFALRRSLDKGLGGKRSVLAGDDWAAERMRAKSARELAVLREACARLSIGVDVLRREFTRGAGVTDTVVAAEHTVIAQGAQDVRSLFSLDQGRTLRPFDIPVSVKPDLLRIYLAVRFDGYWAEASVSMSTARDELTAHAHRIVQALITAARPGLPRAALWDILDGMRGPFALHPLNLRSLGGSIGLSPDDGSLTRDSRLPLLAGEVYALRVGLLDSDRGAFASAMAWVTNSGSERLWPTGNGHEGY